MGKSMDYTLYKPEEAGESDMKTSFWRSRRDSAPADTAVPAPTPAEPEVPDGEPEEIPLEKDLLADLPPAPKETSVITADTVITGNIKTGSNLSIQGRVEGDVDCDSHLYVAGSVLGNIRAGSVKLEGSSVEGSISSDNSIVILPHGQVTGNIAAADVENHGKVMGDISASGTVQMKGTSTLIGNLTAGSLNVESGAVLRGQIEVTNGKSF